MMSVRLPALLLLAALSWLALPGAVQALSLESAQAWVAARHVPSNMTLRLEGVTPRTRVHLLATRYQPAHDLYAELGDVPRATPLAATVPSPRSRYEAERQLPEEVRYVLERGSADPLPGNLLERPSLLYQELALSQDTLTFRGEACPIALTIDQAEPEVRLQAANIVADRRADLVQSACCLSDAARLRDRLERLQLAQLKRHHDPFDDLYISSCLGKV